MAASATFALKAGVWFRRGRLLIVSPDSLGTACPLSGRNSTYRPVQISATRSDKANESSKNVPRLDYVLSKPYTIAFSFRSGGAVAIVRRSTDGVRRGIT